MGTLLRIPAIFLTVSLVLGSIFLAGCGKKDVKYPTVDLDY